MKQRGSQTILQSAQDKTYALFPSPKSHYKVIDIYRNDIFLWLESIIIYFFADRQIKKKKNSIHCLKTDIIRYWLIKNQQQFFL